MNNKIQIAYLMIETREFELHEFELQKDVSYSEVLDFCEYVIGFDKGRVVDREILRSHAVTDDLPFPRNGNKATNN